MSEIRKNYGEIVEKRRKNIGNISQKLLKKPIVGNCEIFTVIFGRTNGKLYGNFE